MDLSAFAKDCARRASGFLAALQKQAPSAKMVGKFAVDQAVREARKVVARPPREDDPQRD
jgi:hypothetical protein